MLLPFLLFTGFFEVLVTPKLTNFVSGFFPGWDFGLNQEAGANPLLNASMLVALVDFKSKIMTTRLGVIVLKCMLYMSNCPPQQCLDATPSERCWSLTAGLRLWASFWTDTVLVSTSTSSISSTRMDTVSRNCPDATAIDLGEAEEGNALFVNSCQREQQSHWHRKPGEKTSVDKSKRGAIQRRYVLVSFISSNVFFWECSLKCT